MVLKVIKHKVMEAEFEWTSRTFLKMMLLVAFFIACAASSAKPSVLLPLGYCTYAPCFTLAIGTRGAHPFLTCRFAVHTY